MQLKNIINKLQPYMTLLFWIVFIYLVVVVKLNIDTMKENPCKLCVEEYKLNCNSIDNRNILLYPGYDWDKRIEPYNTTNGNVTGLFNKNI